VVVRSCVLDEALKMGKPFKTHHRYVLVLQNCCPTTASCYICHSYPCPVNCTTSTAASRGGDKKPKTKGPMLLASGPNYDQDPCYLSFVWLVWRLGGKALALIQVVAQVSRNRSLKPSSSTPHALSRIFGPIHRVTERRPSPLPFPFSSVAFYLSSGFKRSRSSETHMRLTCTTARSHSHWIAVSPRTPHGTASRPSFTLALQVSYSIGF